MHEVTDQVREIFDARYVGDGLAVVVVVLVAWLVARLIRFVIRRVIRRIARRSLVIPALGQAGRWRVRERRLHDGAEVELRRRHRIDAAARMISHLVSLVIWAVAAVVILHVLNVDDITSYVSSAGFIGAAVAIGGQHKVNDYITGLMVIFEDRYGVGDEIEMDVPGNDGPVRAVVDHIGLFSTRVRDARSTLHVPNSALALVRNLSQEAAVSTLRIAKPGDMSAEEAQASLRDLVQGDGITDVVFLGDLAVHDANTGELELEVRTSRALDERTRNRLARRAEAMFER